ncbi:MAG: STAS domain-containing protein [Flavobacteriaceae bacterium]
MNHSVETLKVTIHETQGCLVVPIQEELTKNAALQIQRSLLKQVHAKSVKGVIIDLSGVKIIDSILWEVFSKTTQMVKLLGVPSVITGLSPGVVASIIDMNLDINDLTTAMNLEDALEILTQSTESGDENVPENDVDTVENTDIVENETEEGSRNEET